MEQLNPNMKTKVPIVNIGIALRYEWTCGNTGSPQVFEISLHRIVA